MSMVFSFHDTFSKHILVAKGQLLYNKRKRENTQNQAHFHENITSEYDMLKVNLFVHILYLCSHKGLEQSSGKIGSAKC